MEELDTYHGETAIVDVANTSPLLNARWWITATIVISLILSLCNPLIFPTLISSLGPDRLFTLIALISLVAPICWGLGGFFIRKTNNTYLKHAGALIIACAVIDLILVLLPVLIHSAVSPLVYILENTIYLTLVMGALIGFLYAGEADIQQVYKIGMLYIAQLGIIITGNLCGWVYIGGIMSLLLIIIGFMLIKPWWKLLSTAQPENDEEGQPIVELFNNRATIGFLATGITMFILIFIASKTLI